MTEESRATAETSGNTTATDTDREVEVPAGRLSVADKWVLSRLNKLGEPLGFTVDIEDVEKALPRGFNGVLNSAGKIILALVVIGGVWFGYRWWKKRRDEEINAAWRPARHERDEE